ncbi:hypothetical protein BJX64DRAFT_271340 [Aspergillus heterothallicus]
MATDNGGPPDSSFLVEYAFVPRFEPLGQAIDIPDWQRQIRNQISESEFTTVKPLYSLHPISWPVSPQRLYRFLADLDDYPNADEDDDSGDEVYHFWRERNRIHQEVHHQMHYPSYGAGETPRQRPNIPYHGVDTYLSLDSRPTTPEPLEPLGTTATRRSVVDDCAICFLPLKGNRPSKQIDAMSDPLENSLSLSDANSTSGKSLQTEEQDGKDNEKDNDHNLVWCRVSCGINFHVECLQPWASRYLHRALVTCPYCQARWMDWRGFS